MTEIQFRVTYGKTRNALGYLTKQFRNKYLPTCALLRGLYATAARRRLCSRPGCVSLPCDRPRPQHKQILCRLTYGGSRHLLVPVGKDARLSHSSFELTLIGFVSHVHPLGWQERRKIPLGQIWGPCPYRSELVPIDHGRALVVPSGGNGDTTRRRRGNKNWRGNNELPLIRTKPIPPRKKIMT